MLHLLHRAVHGATLLTLAALAACRDAPTMPDPAPPPVPPTVAARDDAEQRERLARELALSLADSAFRAWVHREIQRSPIREQKLHFQRLLARPDGRALTALAAAARSTPDAVGAEARRARPLELYLPVAAQRAAWDGGADLLVATAATDREAPVAFAPSGERLVLSAAAPPATPVLALVPVETDFDGPAASPFIPCADCGDVPSPGSGTLGAGAALAVAPTGLYLTRASYVSSFEGWLKGDPEFDIHILGKAGGTDSLQSVSCSGRDAPGPYTYTQRSTEWTGNALLYTNEQLDRYKAQYPGQGLRIMVVEDDDGSCVLKVDVDRVRALIAAVEAAWPQLTGGIDHSVPGLVKRVYAGAGAIRNLVRAVASFFLTNDDIIGNAVDVTVTGEQHPWATWIVKGEGRVTNGALRLEMK